MYTEILLYTQTSGGKKKKKKDKDKILMFNLKLSVVWLFG